MRHLLILAVTTGLLTGCASMTGHKQDVGTLLGAATGAGLAADWTSGSDGGGRVMAIAAGTLVGSMVGSEIGKALDEQDRMRMARARQQALEHYPSGRSSTWQNPDTGHRGAVTPQPAYQNDRGQYCREFTQEIEIGGEVQEGYGTACRQPDGSWKII